MGARGSWHTYGGPIDHDSAVATHLSMNPLPGAGSPHCILLHLIAIAFGAPSPVFLVCELASYVGGYGGRHCH